MSSAHALLAALHRAAIQGVSPYPRTHERVRSWLDARESSVPLHILALGKAAPEMARGALQAVREHRASLAGGLVVAAHKVDPSELAPLAFRVGDHPLPSIGSLAAADAIATAIGAVDAGDDVLVLLSGGTTSLCAAPCAELTALIGHPADAQDAMASDMQHMMAHGMAIHEMNAIRRRLLRWGAGRLATALHARGVRRIHVMAISDVIGDDAATIGSGPCTPDPLQLEDVLALCDAHGLRSAFDPAISRALGLAGSANVAIVTPPQTHPVFHTVTYDVIASNADACRAAANAAEQAGISFVVVSDHMLEIDADSLGGAVVQIALRYANEIDERMVLIWGGEPTVNMLDDARVFGDADENAAFVKDDDDITPLAEIALAESEEAPLGGRMQALALAAAITLDGAASKHPDALRISVLAGSTDGRDGPTDAAGAIVDATTARLVRRAGREPYVDLYRLRSYRALDGAGALLRTGPTGTNVMDIVIALIDAR